jgi:lipoyl(octanoyl) transferase
MNKKNNIEVYNSNEAVNYKDSMNLMQKRIVDIYLEKKNELVWFLNHDNIYTMGTSAKITEIHKSNKIPIISTNRGGKTTYHGPGQRIVYLLINLNKRKKDIRKFVKLIEQSTINLLKEFDLEAQTFPQRIGIWITKNNGISLEKEEKIGAIGLRIKKWVTYHGLSFNLNPNMDFYKFINPCGLSEYSTTSMEKLGKKLSQENFDEMYLKYFLDGLKKINN